MINEIAFVGVPVTDIPRARNFYEGVLGFKPSGKTDGAWIEYEIGNGTAASAITATNGRRAIRARWLPSSVTIWMQWCSA